VNVIFDHYYRHANPGLIAPVFSDQDLDSSYNECTLDREARHHFRLKSGEWWRGGFTWQSTTCGHMTFNSD